MGNHKVFELVNVNMELDHLPKYGEIAKDVLETGNFNYRSISKFSTLEEAKAELKKYKCTCYKISGNIRIVYMAEAYMIDIHTEDEDGEFLDGSDYIEAEDGREEF